MTDTKKIKVLSVEDNEFIRLFIKDVMWIHGTSENIEFDSVSTTEEAEKRLMDPTTRPQIVFLDMMLPKNENDSPVLENGLHVLEKIKTDPDLMGIKVLVFSSLKDGEIREKADRLGADRYMVKGEYLPTELIAAVKEIIQKL